VFTKSSGFQHDAIKTDDAPGHGYAFRVLQELGEKARVNFVYSKDGSLLTPEYLAQFAAVPPRFLYDRRPDPGEKRSFRRRAAPDDSGRKERPAQGHRRAG
jgi:hypothetical protein